MKRHVRLKQTGFKRKPPAPRSPKPPRAPVARSSIVSSSRAVMISDLGAAAPITIDKPQTFRSEAWLQAVRGLRCVFCGDPVQAAHRNEGKGAMLKTDDCLTAALCPREHAEIDQGKDMTREERRARMNLAIVLTLRELVRRGKVSVMP